MSPEEKAKADEIYKTIIGKERNSLVKRYGEDAEKVAKGRAIKQAQKLAEKKMESSKDKLKEMVKAALTQEKKEFPDLTGDGKVTKADILKGRGVIDELKQAVVLTDKDHENLMKNGSVAVNVGGQTIVVALKDFDVDMEDYEDPSLDEDIDLGHVDNEPHMLKADLYRIGKYAMELYQMVDEFEGMGEVDFPHWWQSKIIKSKDMLVSAKHYLDFEIKEPQIDAMVDVAAEEDVIDENALGFSDIAKFGHEAESKIDNAVRDDSRYTFGNKPHVDDQLRYEYAKEMGFLEEKKEIKEEDPGEADMVASDIQKLRNDAKNNETRLFQLQLARKAMNKGDLETARKIVSRYLKEGLPKGYWSKKIPGGKMEESYETLVKKIKGQGKSEKAAKAIAGAVASYKAKGGGKGPTAKQKK